MKRPRSHQLDSVAKAAFDLRIPNQWSYQRINPEYGIDGDVEIFGDENQSTGLRFHVQLKGTDKADLSEALRVHLDRKTADHYRALDLPVLMVRYHAPSDDFFVRWFYRYDPYYEKSKRPNRTTITFTWDQSDRWDSQTAGTLERDLRLRRRLTAPSFAWPMRFNVVIEAESLADLSRAEILVSLRERWSSESRLVTLVSDGSTADGTIVLSTTMVRVALGNMHYSATLHLKGEDYFKREELGSIVADILVLVGAALAKAGHLETAARLFKSSVLHSQIMKKTEFSHVILRAYRAAHFVSEALTLAEHLHSEGVTTFEPSFFEIFGMSHASTEDEKRAVVEYLRKRLAESEAANDQVASGTNHYNLGQTYRSMGRLRDAFHHYRLACDHSSYYWKRDYFHQELGALFFDAHRFLESARAYERALALGFSADWILPRLADALRFSGKFRQSRTLLSKYLDGHEFTMDDSYWRLMWRSLGVLRNWLNIDSQKRRSVDAYQRAMSRELDDMPRDDRLVELASILELDGLCAPAWFKLALVQDPMAAPQRRYDAFFSAALAYPNHLDSWGNAILTGGSLLGVTEDEEGKSNINAQLNDLLFSAYFFHGESLVGALSEPMRHVLPKEAFDRFANIIDEAVDEARRAKKSRPFFVRLGSLGPKYESFPISTEPGGELE